MRTDLDVDFSDALIVQSSQVRNVITIPPIYDTICSIGCSYHVKIQEDGIQKVPLYPRDAKDIALMIIGKVFSPPPNRMSLLSVHISIGGLMCWINAKDINTILDEPLDLFLLAGDKYLITDTPYQNLGMDPVTAIGLASGIISFIEFTTSLVRGSYQIYNSASGTTEDNIHTSNVVGDLHAVTKALNVDLKGNTENENALKELATQCQVVSAELDELLFTLKTKNDSKWESVRVKLRNMRKEKDVVSIEKRLNNYREEIILRLDLMMWYEDKSLRD